jgi:hypothetical protein
MNLGAYDHYGYAFVAVAGTFLAAWALQWAMGRPRAQAFLVSIRGVAPPFINIIGVLFGLTLAFLANDTWSAHDRAMNAVYREADSLRTISALAGKLPQASRARVQDAVAAYADAAARVEWPLLGKRQMSPVATEKLDAMLLVIAADEVAAGAGVSVHALMLKQATEARDSRDQRIALSKTHINPLKWLGMAFLGLLAMVSVAAVHADNLRASFVAILLFAASAAPTAAIVLVQGNPFQQPTAVSPAPIAALAAR